MKNKTIRGIALGLATTLIMTVTSGCSKKDVSIPKTASIVSEDADNVYEDYTYYTGGTYVFKGQEYKEAHDPSSEYVINEYTGLSYDDGLNTNILFFIRIDGKIYLATELTDIDENNIISKYYAIDTGEFLGQTLDINWYARATKDIDTIIPPGGVSKTEEYEVFVDNDLKDNNYFNGEYGLGKNLCRESIVNASSLLSESTLNREQIDNLLTDSLLTASIVEKYRYPSFTSYSKEEYTFIPLRYTNELLPNGLGLPTREFTVGFNGKTSAYLKNMYRFTIEDGDSTREIVGYRASINKNDSGFNYIYDIESSCYLDLSKFNVLDVKEVIASKTVGKIRQELEMGYPIENLKVVSTLNLEGDDVFEKYYITMRGEYVTFDTYYYEILGEEDLIALAGSYDGSRMCFAKYGSLKTTSEGEYNGIMDPLKECLTRNGLSNYIKDVYTEEELALLLTKLRNRELDLGTPINEIREAYKKISIEDIVVVDTSKENGDSVLVDGEKRFYVLLPYEQSSRIKDENSDITYYEICDNTGFGAISFERKFIVIDNLSKTFYAVLKTDGELECVSSFEDVLRELGLDDCIQSEYALTDLQTLADKINEKQNVLSLNEI